jgi:hypothetical protein
MTRPATRLGKADSGYTLIEVVMGVALAFLVMQGVFNVMFHWENLFTEQVRQFTLDQSAERILRRLADEVRAADPTTISPTVLSNSSTIQFQRVTGFSGGSAQLGTTVRFGFSLAPGETANGVDQNGNGLADDGFITMQEGTATPIQLAGNVLGLRFTSTATGVTISTDVGMVGVKNNVSVKTFSQDVSFRNP